jgi:hypothetical protein
MLRFLAIVFILGLSLATVSAQSERELKKYFEGKEITLRITLPQQSRGIDLYPERTQSFDFKAYTERLSKHGTSLNRGETAQITNLKVQSNQIKVILADTRTGFNIHFKRLESWMLTPATVVDALSRYVEFSNEDKIAARLSEGAAEAAGYVRRGVVHVGPRTTYLKEGLRAEEVVSLLGEPTSISESERQGQSLLVYEFQRGVDRVLVAEFVDGSLISSRTETRSVALAKPSLHHTVQP